MLLRTKSTAVVATMLSLLFVGCDPQAVVRQQFQKQGLNPVTPVRDYIKVGGLVLNCPDGAVYLDTVYDFPSMAKYKDDGKGAIDNPMQPFSAMIASFQSDNTTSANASTKLVQTFIPLSVSGGFKLGTGAKLDQVDAAGERINVQKLRMQLGSEEAVPVRAYVASLIKQPKTKVFVIDEIYQAKSINLSTSGSTEVTTSVSVDSQISNVASASGKFDLSRTSKTNLTIKGDKYYVVGVRAARLMNDPTTKEIVMMPGQFKFDKALSATEVEKYTQPISVAYAPIKVSRLSELTPEKQQLYGKK